MINNPLTTAGEARDVSMILGSGRSLGRWDGNPLQYSCWENPMDTGTWKATVHGIPKSWTWLSNWAYTVCERIKYAVEGKFCLPYWWDDSRYFKYPKNDRLHVLYKHKPHKCICRNAKMLHPCRMHFEFILTTGRTKDDKSHDISRTTTWDNRSCSWHLKYSSKGLSHLRNLSQDYLFGRQWRIGKPWALKQSDRT